ncbi:MAG TPA: peptidase M20, partial [Sphingomicrobium sp.]|nr:peptidase M20 [Sphingomicrobium sp.]
MRTLARLSAVAFLLSGAAAVAQTAPFDPARIDAHIKTLSSDEFEGRGPATPGEQKTVAYLVQKLQAAGVEPGGEVVNGRRQWTQRV